MVDLYGPSDFSTGPTNINTHGGAAVPRTRSVPREREPDNIMQRASPVTYVSSNAPPFLIFHGSKDPLVSIQSVQSYYSSGCARLG